MIPVHICFKRAKPISRHYLSVSNFWRNICDFKNGTPLKLNQHLSTWLTAVPRPGYYFKFHAQVLWFLWVMKLFN